MVNKIKSKQIEDLKDKFLELFIAFGSAFTGAESIDEIIDHINKNHREEIRAIDAVQAELAAIDPTAPKDWLQPEIREGLSA